MSWAFDEEGVGLVNLDHCETISIFELEPASDGKTHCVIAQLEKDGDTDVRLFTGTEEQCRSRLIGISSKLHIIKAS